jgi:glutaredoxin-like protein NrdH
MAKSVHVYALSTCGWCRRTKAFLEDNHIDYTCDEVDLLEGEEKQRAKEALERANPRRSYPTIVIDDADVIVGYDEEKLKTLLSS